MARSRPVIHPAAAPNHLVADELRIRPERDGSVAIDPEGAGWRYLSFRAAALLQGETVDAGVYGQEAVIVVVGSGGVRIETDGRSLSLPGRSGPFEALPWAAYLPAGFPGRVIGQPSVGASREPARVVVAIAEAPPSGSERAAREPIVIGPDDVEVEIRGAGNAARQINKIVQPGFPADRLEVVEVLTPSGNWSSWPPHKHDTDDWPQEAVLEEVYYYRFRTAEAWGLQRLYRADRSRDCIWGVGQGDLVLVTDGYHPFVAAHGWDAYYLNALAGDRRTMACSYDPALDWTRAGWAQLEPDPRLPMVRPVGERPVEVVS